MKSQLLFMLILINFNVSFGQKNESEILKDYEFYIEKNVEMGKWKTKYYLSSGLVNIQETYWKNELRSRTEFKYDRYDNVECEIMTYHINEGKINYVSNLNLEYNDSLLISKGFSFDMTEKYFDFNESGKPKLIERNEQTNLQAFPYKEIIEYDKKDNVTKSTELSISVDLNGKTIKEKKTTYFKYDKWNNIIEIYREYEPEQEFPVIMTGGPAKYKYEYFRYKYNKNGLWIKKLKTVNGKENLVAKRKYKKH